MRSGEIRCVFQVGMAKLLETGGLSNSSDIQSFVKSLIEQGECFARSGRLDLSFRSFSNAFRLGEVPKECIASLVTACLEFQRTKLSRETREERSTDGDLSESEVFSCMLCNCVFMKPVTLSCGHTFCEVCLSEEKSFNGFLECCKCGNAVADNVAFSVNVLVMNAIQKWLPNEYQKQEKKLRGMNYFIMNDVKSAIDCFSGVLSQSSNDFHCLSWRSDAFLRMGQLELALRDIDQACRLRPRSAKSFYRKAVILAKFAEKEGIISTRHEESVIALLRCYSLVPNSHRYRQEFTESLHQLLRPKFTNINRTMSVLKQNHSQGSEFPHTPILSRLDLPHEKTSADAGKAKGTVIKKRIQKVTDSKTLRLSVSSQNENRDTEKAATSILNPGESKAKKDVIHLTEVEDFECKLCYNLLFQPITTLCGHTFCRECLERSLDHKDECPCCRMKLSQYLARSLKMEVTDVLQHVLMKHFPADYHERSKMFEEKINALSR